MTKLSEDQLNHLSKEELVNMFLLMDDTDLRFIDDLLPWAPNVRATCSKPLKSI